MGLEKKIRLRRTARPTFRVLRSMRRLRGTALDPFGYAKVRRTERALVDEYLDSMDQALQALIPTTQQAVAAIAGLPDMVRGYEDIKLENVQRFRDEVRALGF